MGSIPAPLKHFFFSELRHETEKQLKKLNANCGKLKSITYIIDNQFNGKSLQRVEMENYKGDAPLDESDKKAMCEKTGADYDKMKKEVKFLFIKLDFKTKNIFIEKTLFTGEKETDVL